MPTAIGLGKRATRSSSSCPASDRRSASAALVTRTNSSISAPAMKLSRLPEKNAAAGTAASRSSTSNVARTSCFTACEILLTGSPFRSKTTTEQPSTSLQGSGGPREEGKGGEEGEEGGEGGISGAPAPSRS